MFSFSGVSALLLGLSTLYVVLYRLQLRRDRPDEPPVVPAPGLPFLGHVLCMALQGGRYMQQLGLRLQHKTPLASSGPSADAGIVTLPVPGSRIYLVTDPSLAAAVQRVSRALSFTPLVPDVTRRVLGLDDRTVRIVRGDNLAVASSPMPRPAANANADAGAATMSIVDEQKYDESYGFLADIHELVYNYMGPGDTLTRFVQGAVVDLVGQVNAFADKLEAGGAPPSDNVDLLAWMKHFVTVGTAQFLYGQRNPLAVEPGLETAFWDFVHGLGRLLLVGDRRPGSLAAALLGGRPFAARERLVDGFRAYLEADEHLRDDCSEIVRRRVAIADRYGWARASTARSELSFLFAGIINTAVTSFWVVLRLYSDPDLLRTVRDELESANAGDGNDNDMLSVEHVRTNCPTLQAVYQECLRLGSNNMSTRLVLSDTMLADRYFLRAGSVVQIAAGVIHADPALWGADVNTFDPGRFLPRPDKKPSSSSASGASAAAPKRHPAAFRAFGGGKTLCPGRHFATAEILSFTAAVILTFDAEDAAESAKGRHMPPKVPPRNDRVLPIHILEPSPKDVSQVRLRLRRGDGQRLRVVP